MLARNQVDSAWRSAVQGGSEPFTVLIRQGFSIFPVCMIKYDRFLASITQSRCTSIIKFNIKVWVHQIKKCKAKTIWPLPTWLIAIPSGYRKPEGKNGFLINPVWFVRYVWTETQNWFFGRLERVCVIMIYFTFFMNILQWNYQWSPWSRGLVLGLRTKRSVVRIPR